MEQRKGFSLTSAALHLFAMACMLCDHLWATVVPGNEWLTCIGRIAFPIFAFLLVEGYTHTSNVKKYALRLLIFALISEIPFNMVISNGALFYPVHQNILWTLLLGLGLIHWNDRVKHKHLAVRILIGLITVVIGFVGGLLTMVDYHHAGVLTILLFYFLRRRCWWTLLLQIAGMWYIHAELLGGVGYPLTIGSWEFFLPRQALALLALIPIWLYSGEQGYHAKWFRRFCYGFYPLHLLILGLICRFA